uniref:LAGLIDADG endonuclease n=1 Tax=Juglanconis juglandina TaxID=1940567 RepID=A0A291LJD2_9PEZI|nr:LAGLIDADG endonuclease [Juglanconis juglandina]
MNTNRTVWNRNNSDLNITPNWLLGYVEGDGSFYISKENFSLFFTISQTMNDLPLMKAIKNYLNALNSHFNDAVYLTTYKSKTDQRSDMINLIATKSEFISQVLIPLFQNLRWASKKELDFVDWISILKIKQLGIHHTEQGVAMIQRLIGQMNNNRLSTSPCSTLEDRNSLLLDLKTMLEAGSNYIINDKGQTIIKSTGKYLKKGSPIAILIIDGEGNILNELKSINACASFLGISHDTVRVKLRSGKSIKFNSNLVYVKNK